MSEAQVEIEQPAAQPTELAMAVQKVSAELAGFDKIAAGLAALQAEHPADVVLDVSKSDGMKAAIKSRAAWREPRIAIEKVRKAAKAPVLDLGRKIDTFAESLTAQLRIGEENYDGQIQAELTRKAEEKRRAEEAESRRVLDIKSRISQAFECAPGRAFGRPAAAIREEIQATTAVPIDEAHFAEFVGEATKAQAAALADMRGMLERAEAQEAEAERLKLERAEYERKAAELVKARAEFEAAQRQARAEQEAREATERKEREAREAKERQEREAREAEARAREEAIRAEQKRLDDAMRAAHEAKAAEERRAADEAAAAERRRLDEEAAARRQREEEERAAEIARATAERMAREEAEAKAAVMRAKAARRLAAAQKAGPRLLEVLKRIAADYDGAGSAEQAGENLADAMPEVRAAIAEAEAA